MKKFFLFSGIKKTVIILLFSVSFLGLIVSCFEFDETEGKCDSGYLECDNGRCCPSSTPFSDGHGTCWGTLEGCRKTGYACQKCW